MRKTTKVLEFTECRKHFICIRHNDMNLNPFWLYEIASTWEQDIDGQMRWKDHKKLIVKYQDMTSVMYEILQRIR